MSEQFFQNSDAQNEAEAKAKAEEVQRQQEQNPFFMDDAELQKDRYYSMYSGDDLIYGESIKLEFTLPRLLRSTVGLLVAKGSVGKSMLCLQTMLSSAVGLDLFGIWTGKSIKDHSGYKNAGWTKADSVEVGMPTDPDDPGNWHLRKLKSAVLSLEDGHPVVKTRIERMIEDLPDAIKKEASQNILEIDVSATGFLACEVVGRKLVPTLQFKQAYADLEKFKPDVVYIDTLTLLAGNLDQNSAGEMGQLLALLKQMASQLKCSIVLLHHTVKGGSGTGGEDARGSSAIPNNARWQMNMTTMTEEEAVKFFESDDDSIREQLRKKMVRLHNAKMNYGDAIEETNWLRKEEGGVIWHCEAEAADIPDNLDEPANPVDKPKKKKNNRFQKNN